VRGMREVRDAGDAERGGWRVGGWRGLAGAGGIEGGVGGVGNWGVGREYSGWIGSTQGELSMGAQVRRQAGGDADLMGTRGSGNVLSRVLWGICVGAAALICVGGLVYVGILVGLVYGLNHWADNK
jgi:hypothetical protein